LDGGEQKTGLVGESPAGRQHAKGKAWVWGIKNQHAELHTKKLRPEDTFCSVAVLAKELSRAA